MCARRSGGGERAATMPVAASAIYFLNLRGDVLINRLYRDDVGCVVPFAIIPPSPRLVVSPRLLRPRRSWFGVVDLRPLGSISSVS